MGPTNPYMGSMFSRLTRNVDCSSNAEEFAVATYVVPNP